MTQDKDRKDLNVPPLRFPGFTDEWKERPLNQLVERVIRKNKNEESKIALTISAQYGLVDQEAFFNNKVASSDLSHYYLLYKGEYAYNKSYSSGYPWGTVKRLNNYDKGVVSPLYICFRPLDTVDSDFIGHYFESSKWHKGASEIAVEGARNHGLLNIGVKDFFSTTHFVPSLDEQKKIASILSVIDERIATQNKIIDDLHSLIKGLREQLFQPFLSNRIKLGSIAQITNGNGDVQDAISEYQADLFPFFDRSDEVKYFKDYSFDEEAIIYAGEGSEFLPRYYNGKFALHQRCYAITILSSDFSPRYIYHYLQTQNNYFIRNAVGSTVPSLRMDCFQKICIPNVDKKIQEYIINRLETICEKIDNEKRLLLLYQRQKVYLLQKLFI